MRRSAPRWVRTPWRTCRPPNTRLGPGLPIVRALLFGSQARGDARPDSDVDIIIVSPGFEGMSAGQRGYAIRRAWDLPVPVDFLCYTPAEFEALARRTTIVRLALDEGRDLALA